MSRVKILVYLLLYTSCFYLMFLLGESFFYVDTKNQYIQDTYIEKTQNEDVYTDLNTPLTEEEKIAYKKRVLQKKLEDTKELAVLQTSTQGGEDNPKFTFVYIPDTIVSQVTERSELIESLFHSAFFSPKVSYLRIEMIEKVGEVRGKFKDSAIKLFGVFELPKDELLSVFIHEFGHYVDLYFLDKDFRSDPSDKFYELSWDASKTLKKGSKQGDFVSGYAMTNKYEDFAESFTYYVLHNAHFLEKTKNSPILQAKYNFFSQSVFRDGEFQLSNFSTEKRIKSYYRDITKISYDIEKFLQYLKKTI